MQDALGDYLRNGGDEDELDTIVGVYKKFWNDNQQELGHYFRYLYRIFKFVHDSKVPDKHLYSGIVRAQLSNKELLLLYYNGISSFGREKLKPLIEEYNIFDNLPRDTLLRPSHVHFYHADAWGEQQLAIMEDSVARPPTR